MKRILLLFSVILLVSCEYAEIDNMYIQFDPDDMETLLIKHNVHDYYESPNGEEVTVEFSHQDSTFNLTVETKKIDIDYFFFNGYDYDDIEDEVKNIVTHKNKLIVVEGIKFKQQDIYEISISDTNY